MYPIQPQKLRGSNPLEFFKVKMKPIRCPKCNNLEIWGHKEDCPENPMRWYNANQNQSY